MFISELYKKKKPVISFEMFPPKKDSGVEPVYAAIGEMAALEPDFISVTCGAGGSANSGKTGQIASEVKNTHKIEALAHLTCIAADKARIRETVSELKGHGIENILALRGDLPEDGSALSGSYGYASDLIKDLVEFGGFSIGAAAYPEGHIECEDEAESLARLKEKQDSGASFLITQLFFDNGIFYKFIDKAQAAGITIPVSAGIMPILSRQQVERMIFLCGASLPSGIIKLLHKYAGDPRELRKAGIEYAIKQMLDLKENGAQGIHVYSMNQPDIARLAMRSLR